MLLRTSLTSKVLLEGQYGAILAVQHLTPFMMNPTAAATAAGGGTGGVGGGRGKGVDGGGVDAGQVGAGAAGAAAAGRSLQDDAARRAFFDSVSNEWIGARA
jgi:hypothetical protein